MRPAAAATALLLPAVKQFLKNSISRFQFMGRTSKLSEKRWKICWGEGQDFTIHIHKAIKFIARFIMTRDSNATLIKLYTAMCVCVCLV